MTDCEVPIIPTVPQVLWALFYIAFWFGMGWSWRGRRDRSD